jgi:hypothetical protein
MTRLTPEQKSQTKTVRTFDTDSCALADLNVRSPISSALLGQLSK